MIQFFDDPLLSLLYMLFAVMVLLLWKKPLVSLVGACGTGLLSMYLGRISPLGMGLFLVMLSSIYVYYKRPLPSWAKLVLGLAIAVVSVMFYLHFVPGFRNWLMIDQYPVSPNAWTYNLYLNADKILVGTALVALGQRLNQSWGDWEVSFKDAAVPFVVLAIMLMGASLAVNYVAFDPKLSPVLWLWLPTSFLFVCVIEEVLFRGFIQKELSLLMANVKGGQVYALLIASIVFGLFHYKGGPYYIALSGIAGIGYGYAYMKSQKLEAAILTHFFVNLIHILFFTYPALL